MHALPSAFKLAASIIASRDSDFASSTKAQVLIMIACISACGQSGWWMAVKMEVLDAISSGTGKMSAFQGRFSVTDYGLMARLSEIMIACTWHTH